MIDIIQAPIILVMGMTVTCSGPRLVKSLTGEQEDLCSIYPLCADYGPGKHEVLEDCTKYIECEEQPDGFYTQNNMECPDNLVFTNRLGRCGDPTLATECTDFGNLKCKEECPRVHFSSSGLSSTTHNEALGCYRLKGSKDLNRVAFYENSQKLTLTPFPTNIWVSWHVTANIKCPYSGLIVNEEERYVRCPRSDWRGWDVRTGGGYYSQPLYILSRVT